MTLSDTNGEQYIASGNTLLVFLDESGGSGFNDPNATFFGFGGLVVEGRRYMAEIESRWYAVKDDQFGGRERPLHAADLGKPTEDQIDSLNGFFDRETFGRFAVMVTDMTNIECIADAATLASACLWSQIRTASDGMRYRRVLVLYEENPQLVPSLQREFMSRVVRRPDSHPVVVDYRSHLKDPLFAGMEVADFIVHTAGRQARKYREFQRVREDVARNPDFERVFPGAMGRACLFINRAYEAR